MSILRRGIYAQHQEQGIVTDNLVQNLDAGNVLSYPGTGTLWTDTINGYNATLINGPVYNTDGGGNITFDSVNDYGSVSHNSDLNPDSGDFSFSIWVKYNGAPLTTTSVLEALISKGIYNVNGNEWELIFRGGSYNGFYFRMRVGGVAQDINLPSDQRSIIEDGNFHMITVSIEKGALNEGRMYLDNNLVGTRSSFTLNISNTAPLYIARYSSIYGAVKVANQLVYKGKGLTDSEVQQNFDATKSRYGY